MQVDVYDGTADFLRKLELDEDALTKAIIGTIGDIDSYQLPDAKGYTAFLRHILGVTDEERQQRREQILGTTLKDFRCRLLLAVPVSLCLFYYAP
jgi:Zn-dependent M16 (insulinase) family peptidase